MNTREQNIEIVRRACVKANPEIVELKFGCVLNTNFLHAAEPVPFNPEGKPMRVVANGRVLTKIEKTYVPTHVGCNLTLYFSDGSFVRQYTEDGTLHDAEILGRPIRLNDVLLAAGADGIGTETPHDLISILVVWNYWKDDLNEQDDATLEVIASIIREDKN